MAEVMEHIDAAHGIERFPLKLAFAVVEFERNIWMFHFLSSRVEHRLVSVGSDDARIRQSPGQRFGEMSASAPDLQNSSRFAQALRNRLGHELRLALIGSRLSFDAANQMARAILVRVHLTAGVVEKQRNRAKDIHLGAELFMSRRSTQDSRCKSCQSNSMPI